MASLIEIISPKWAANRARARLQLERAKYVSDRLGEIKGSKRSYEGASQGRRNVGWITSDEGPAGAAPYTLRILRDRSRYFSKNNPFFNRAVHSITANTVGDGIQARVDGKVRAIRRGADAGEVWRQWAGSTACDADSRLDFYGLQALVMRTIIESGEVLVRRRKRKAGDGPDVPLQIQILEPDMLADDVMGLGTASKRERIRGGIEFDRKGRRIAYHLHKAHPKSLGFATAQDTVRIPAAEILHIYRVDRPGQIRGVPWAAPVMNRLKQLDDYEDAALERARVAACFSAFVIEPDSTGLPNATDEQGNDVEWLERVEPGMIEHLTPGRDVKFGTPPSTSDYPEFVRANLRAVAAGLDLPYEMLGDLSQVNFSSARMGWLEARRQFQAYQWTMLVPLFCEPVFGWWQEAARVSHGVRDASAVWTPPRAEMVDPAKEIGAAKDAVRCGFMSWAEAVREWGYEPDAVLAEIAEYNEKADELGVTLDTDPRTMSKAGQTQQPNENEEDEDEGSSDDGKDEEDEDAA